jgi:hypothetical protein
MEWTLMKQRVTGQKEEMEQEDIDRVLSELAREWMSVSKLRKLPGQVAKESDAALLNNFRQHPRRSSTVKNSPNSAKLSVDTAQSDQIMGWP